MQYYYASDCLLLLCLASYAQTPRQGDYTISRNSSCVPRSFSSCLFSPGARFGLLDLCRQRRSAGSVLVFETFFSKRRVEFEQPSFYVDGLVVYGVLFLAWTLNCDLFPVSLGDRTYCCSSSLPSSFWSASKTVVCVYVSQLLYRTRYHHFKQTWTVLSAS